MTKIVKMDFMKTAKFNYMLSTQRHTLKKEHTQGFRRMGKLYHTNSKPKKGELAL